jgi:hypothetical protein
MSSIELVKIAQSSMAVTELCKPTSLGANLVCGFSRREKNSLLRDEQTSAPAGIYAGKCATVEEWCESVAQLVEHRPFKALVLGSNPSALTILSLQRQNL